jgi:hypothetical protein
MAQRSSRWWMAGEMPLNHVIRLTPQASNTARRARSHLPFQPLGAGRLPKGLALFGSQPVSQADSEFFVPVTRRIIASRSALKEAAVGSFV